MFNVGEIIYTIDTLVDKENNPVGHRVGQHQIAGVHVDQSGVVYDFAVNNQIFKVPQNKVAGSFEVMTAMIEAAEGDMTVCRRCGAVIKKGEGFSIPGLTLCPACVNDVKAAISEPCECEKGDCKCECHDAEA